MDFGFRLPSALDNRPMQFEEFEQHVYQAIYVSATPGPYERQHSQQAAIVVLSNLAACLQALGRPEEALPLYWQAVRNAEATLGRQHPQAAHAVSNLAGCLLHCGQLAPGGAPAALLERELGLRRERVRPLQPLLWALLYYVDALLDASTSKRFT